MQKEGGERREI